MREVSEAIEEISHYGYENGKIKYDNAVREECADVIIRVMNFCSRKGLDLQTVILEKNKKNLTRGFLHGKNV